MPRRHVVYRPSPKDITEYLADLRLEPARGTGETVAYHPACSLQHGQQVRDLPKRVLKKVGFMCAMFHHFWLGSIAQSAANF